MMEAGHTHDPDETIEPIIQAVEYTYSHENNLEDVLPKFYETPVILVTKEDRPAGILTKIDVLDFIARKI
jgi:CBS domain-containing protein